MVDQGRNVITLPYQLAHPLIFSGKTQQAAGNQTLFLIETVKSYQRDIFKRPYHFGEGIEHTQLMPITE